MVYCSKCGTQNPDDANVCSNCGAPLYGARPDYYPYSRHWRRHEYYHDHYHDHGTWGGGIAALAIGALIILAGLSVLLSTYYNISIPWGAIVLFFIGVLIIFAGLSARRHWKRYT
jgi:hypothetical protein